MNRRSFTPRIESLERRLLMTVPAATPASPVPAASPVVVPGDVAAALPTEVTLSVESNRGSKTLTVRLHELDEPMLIGVAGGSAAWTDPQGIVRLVLPADATRLDLTMGDGSHAALAPFLRIELGPDGQLAGYARIASDAMVEGHSQSADSTAMPMAAMDHSQALSGNIFSAMSQGFAMGSHDTHAVDEAMAHGSMAGMNAAASLGQMNTIHSGQMPVAAREAADAVALEIVPDATHSEAEEEDIAAAPAEAHEAELQEQTLDAVLAGWSGGGDPEATSVLDIAPEMRFSDALAVSEDSPLPAPAATCFPTPSAEPAIALPNESEPLNASWRLAGAVTVAVVSAAGAIWLERRRPLPPSELPGGTVGLASLAHRAA